MWTCSCVEGKRCVQEAGLPLRVQQCLALAAAIEPDQVLDGRRLNPARRGHALQHLVVGLAIGAPRNRAQGGVGLHRRGVRADPFALDQPMLGQALQHPGEDLIVHLKRQARAGTAQPGLVRHRLALAKTQEHSQRETVGTAPLQPAFAVDPFEIAHQQHTEVAPRRQRRATTPRRVEGRALAFHEGVDVDPEQHRLRFVVEDVAWRSRHLRPRHQHLCLKPVAVPAPSTTRRPRPKDSESSQPEFVNGLLQMMFRPNCVTENGQARA